MYGFYLERCYDSITAFGNDGMAHWPELYLIIYNIVVEKRCVIWLKQVAEAQQATVALCCYFLPCFLREFWIDGHPVYLLCYKMGNR